MSALELMIWSMAMGAIGAVVAVGLTDLVMVRSTAAQGLVYHLGTLVFVLIRRSAAFRCGHWPALDPVCPAGGAGADRPAVQRLGNYWIRGWLSAHQRDRFMSVSLQISAAGHPGAGAGLPGFAGGAAAARRHGPVPAEHRSGCSGWGFAAICWATGWPWALPWAAC
jgi:hypothetical protein